MPRFIGSLTMTQLEGAQTWRRWTLVDPLVYERGEGRLMLSARQTGNEIRIAILDDGRGIDADQVVARAIERATADARCVRSVQ